MKRKARVIAFYLPQFHPIPENDKYWGKGFTEWTNVGSAKPLFKGHYQPRVPADLGYYDLRMPEVREAQAEMAREAGVEGFCYWHYWFGNGKQLLERPFNEVLESGRPDFPFCLGWANHSWTTGTWQKDGRESRTMIAEQTYPGDEDILTHFNYVVRAFKDKRYITVDGKPLFLIFDPYSIPNVERFIEKWQKLAVEHGLKGIHFVAYSQDSMGGPGIMENGVQITKGHHATDDYSKLFDFLLNKGFDAIASIGTWRAEVLSKSRWFFIFHRIMTARLHMRFTNKYDYKKIMKHYYVPDDSRENVYPSLLPQWDRSPRSGVNGIYYNSTPENFKKSLECAIELIKNKQDEHKILFLKSWNEWAEGNYVEPDLKYGHGYLDVIKELILE